MSDIPEISGWTFRERTLYKTPYGTLRLYSCQWHDTFSPPVGNTAYAWFDDKRKRRSKYCTLQHAFKVKIEDTTGKSLW